MLSTSNGIDGDRLSQVYSQDELLDRVKLFDRIVLSIEIWHKISNRPSPN
jgi:hypothetical protein